MNHVERRSRSPLTGLWGLTGILVLVAVTISAPVAVAADPLPSWNDTVAKRAIVDFVDRVTDEGSPGFVPAAERIATFDNDGTLWAEQPMYAQLAFVLERVRSLASEHPQWKDEEPFASVLKGDLVGVAAAGESGMMKMLAATHAGISVEEFDNTAREWIDTARHPETGEPYTHIGRRPIFAAGNSDGDRSN